MTTPSPGKLFYFWKKNNNKSNFCLFEYCSTISCLHSHWLCWYNVRKLLTTQTHAHNSRWQSGHDVVENGVLPKRLRCGLRGHANFELCNRRSLQKQKGSWNVKYKHEPNDRNTETNKSNWKQAIHLDLLKGQSNEIFNLHFFIIRICLIHWPMG